MQNFSVDLKERGNLKLVYPQIKGKMFSLNYYKYVDNFLLTVRKKKKKKETNRPVVKNGKSWISKAEGIHWT